MLTQLPQKYYLAHARELFGFVQSECASLLNEQQLGYLNGISQLSENAECLLVRCLARKPKFIKAHTLNYPEIDNIAQAIHELTNQGYISSAAKRDWPQLAPLLTKPQLVECLAYSPVAVKKSSSKAVLLEHALANLSGDEDHLNDIYRIFIVRRQSATVDYILFLFFGDLRNRFQQFAMRDLGVLRTRKTAKTVARFDNVLEAQSAFELLQRRRDFMQQPEALKDEVADYLITHQAIGHSAQEIRDTLLLSVGNALLADDASKAIATWRASNDPAAIEKWVRESYKNHDRAELARELENLRQEELPAATKVFIEDFYARKYQGKRTSVFTDMLRESARTLAIDEAFINDVEEGVIQHYQRHGVDAYFTENKLWRVLFALTFWDLLFGAEQTQFSEFDRLPNELHNNTFYRNKKSLIEQKLQLLNHPNQAFQTFAKLVVKHYGKPTGIFRWSNTLLGTLQTVLQYSPPSAIAKVLDRMAKNYRHTRDGYPDLMVIENGQLRFEEVKAPGDVLRPNQLVSINRMRDAGFIVDVSQIKWSTNPKQTYAVVDIETTGGRKGGNAITEIAVVKVRKQKIVGQWSTLLNPQRHIPAHITRLTGINNSMVAGAPVFSEIADELNEQLNGCIFVAHNVGFDYGFIKAAYGALGQPFKKPKYCTVRNSRTTFPGLSSYSLGRLCEHFDIDLVGHHRALNDAMATAHLLCLLQEAKLPYA